MSSPNTTVTADESAVRFPSLSALRVVHGDLLKRYRVQAASAEVVAEVEEFIRQAQMTGALLDDDDDRRTAQSLLDYWATMLYSAGHEPPDAALAEFDPVLAPDLDDALCPYLGLDAFRDDQHHLFFGRQWLIQDLADWLKEHRILAVVGPSGSGKSSLVRGGLVPVLQAGALADSQAWHYLPPMLPGSKPLIALARTLVSLPAMVQPAGVSTAEWAQRQAEMFRLDTSHLAHLISGCAAASVVFVIDQFEEIFTLCDDDQARRAFVDNLLSLFHMPGAQHTLILTIRSDFESHVAQLPVLYPLFQEAKHTVPALSARELRDAIERPAQLVGLKFEAGVVDALIGDILGEPAGLPLLQFTLLKLWEYRERSRVTWETYRRLGGARMALATSANEFYERLIPEEQVTAKRILLRMVRPGIGLEVTSNRVRRNELYQAGEAHDRVDRVLEKLIQARLVRLTEGDAPGDAQVEVAHEALVRNWGRLVDWLEAERERLRYRRRLTAAAEQWQAHGRDPGGLLGGSLLEEALHYPDLNDLEVQFVQASQASVAEAEREKEAARQRELAQAQALVEEQRLRADAERQRSEALEQVRRRLIRAVRISLMQSGLLMLALIWAAVAATELAFFAVGSLICLQPLLVVTLVVLASRAGAFSRAKRG